jgi:hypothetical protein
MQDIITANVVFWIFWSFISYLPYMWFQTAIDSYELED